MRPTVFVCEKTFKNLGKSDYNTNWNLTCSKLLMPMFRKSHNHSKVTWKPVSSLVEFYLIFMTMWFFNSGSKKIVHLDDHLYDLSWRLQGLSSDFCKQPQFELDSDITKLHHQVTKSVQNGGVHCQLRATLDTDFIRLEDSLEAKILFSALPSC